MSPSQTRLDLPDETGLNRCYTESHFKAFRTSVKARYPLLQEVLLVVEL